ncbi:MAG: cupin [Chloroflexota bacterium]|nr:MAG: cupin [Chloroflexota bacterium]
MRIFCFDDGFGGMIDDYGSKNVVFSRIARLSGDAYVSSMHVGPNGVIGYHQAMMPQLFLVVQGDGWVRGRTAERTRIRAGQAAFWETGEWHESGTETDMLAIVIEVQDEEFDPAEFLSNCF